MTLPARCRSTAQIARRVIWVLRDATLMATAIWALVDEPAALEHHGIPDAVSNMWALALLTGAVLCATGSLLRHPPLIITGGLLSGTGMAIWATAALMAADSLQSPVQAGICAALALGQWERASDAFDRQRGVS